MPKFTPNPPAEETAILELTKPLAGRLPSAYLKDMTLANGGEGFVGKRFVSLWRIEELSQLNQDYEIAENAPDLFLIGSNGGGEGYAFNLTKADGAVYRVPFIGMQTSEAQLVAENFGRFLPAVNLTQGQAIEPNDVS